jgi:hypothetical protein
MIDTAYSPANEISARPELTAGRICLPPVLNLFVNRKHRGEDDNPCTIV